MTDLQALGKLLRDTREAQALSLSEAEVHTKIRAKFLQALENGDLSILPSPAHARGFLRNYAQFLQLDVHGIVEQFNALTGSSTRAVTTITAPKTPPAPRYEPPAQRPAQLQSSPALPPEPLPEPVAAVQPQDQIPTKTTQQSNRSAYLTPEQWTGPSAPRALSPDSAAAQAVSQPRDVGPVQTLLRSNIFSGAILLIAFLGIAVWMIVQLSKVSGEDISADEQPSEFLEAFEATMGAVTPSPTFAPTSTAAPDSGPQIFDRVLLTITVTQRSWTRITVDGVVEFEGQAEPNTVLQYEGSESIVVLTGNAAAFSITYNGQDIGVLGNRGTVVERFFTPGGQMTPTATPTEVPTNTPVPTPTPDN